jgi:predicted ferric reductase
MFFGYFLRHLGQFAAFILTIILIIGLLYLIGDTFWRLTIIFAISAVYLGFGLAHHQEEKNLNFSTILEYLFIALIILITLYSIFIR